MSMPKIEYIPIIVIISIIISLPSVSFCDELHKVRQGETLAGIANIYFPYTAAYTKDELIRDIKEMNGIELEHINIGQQLRIPVIADAPVRARSVKKPKAFVAKGVYINKGVAGSRELFSIVNEFSIYGANTIVFDAKDAWGGLSYKSSIPHRFSPSARSFNTIEDISKLIHYMHCMDIHVVARVCAFKDIAMSSSMHHWRIQRGWLNPADPEVQDYILAILEELTDLGVDEIQLDYLRYPADGMVSTSSGDKTRVDIITEFLKRIKEELSPKGVLLSMDIFGIVIWTRDEDVCALGQDISRMSPYLDIISPMLYPSHFEGNFAGIENPADRPYLFVSSGIKRLKAMVGDDVVIRPWLQAFPLRVRLGFGPEFVQTQIKAAKDWGARGWLLWSPGNYYKDAYIAMENISRCKDLDISRIDKNDMPIGGSAQESNLPGTLDAPHSGFEVRGTHQDPSASEGVYSIDDMDVK